LALVNEERERERERERGTGRRRKENDIEKFKNLTEDRRTEERPCDSTFDARNEKNLCARARARVYVCPELKRNAGKAMRGRKCDAQGRRKGNLSRQK